MLHAALALSALALWKADSDEARGPAFTGGIAAAFVLPAWWVVLREQWSRTPAVAALAGLGLILMAIRLVKELPPLSPRRRLLLLPLVGLWILLLASPSRFVPADSKTTATEEEE